MAYFKTRNLALGNDTFKEFSKTEDLAVSMTFQGVINKTFILLFLAVASASISWSYLVPGKNFEELKEPLLICLIWALILGFAMVINNKSSIFLAPIYSLLQGFSLGIISAIAETIFPGIVIQAIAITVGIFISILIINKLRIIKPTENFKLIVSSITAGLSIFYCCVFFLRKLGIEILFIHEGSIEGIIFSVFVILMASLNFVMDFDFIAQGESKKVPKYMEWYCAFGLIVTIIWLYIEVLNLLLKSRSRK